MARTFLACFWDCDCRFRYETGPFRCVSVWHTAGWKHGLGKRRGKLIIEIDILDFDEAFAREHPSISAGASVVLAITGNEVGMDEATRLCTFEPFFTTEEIWEGKRTRARYMPHSPSSEKVLA